MFQDYLEKKIKFKEALAVFDMNVSILRIYGSLVNLVGEETLMH